MLRSVLRCLSVCNVASKIVCSVSALWLMLTYIVGSFKVPVCSVCALWLMLTYIVGSSKVPVCSVCALWLMLTYIVGSFKVAAVHSDGAVYNDSEAVARQTQQISDWY